MAGTGDEKAISGGETSPLSARLLKLALFVGVTGALLYGLLSMVPPQYKSVTTLSLAGQAGSPDQLIAREMSALASNSMIRSFVDQHRLLNGMNFDFPPSRTGPLERVLILLGTFDDPVQIPQNNQVLERVKDNLSIHKGADAQTIAIGMRSSDPKKAARMANLYAQTYIAGLMADNASRPSAMAIDKQRALITRLRDKILNSETKIAAYQADIRLKPFQKTVRRDKKMSNALAKELEKGDKVQLSLDELSQLTAQLILARADREQAELRAKLVHDMLETNGRIERTSTVLNTGLTHKLLIKRARMEQKLADLLIAMLPSHPQVRRLNRSLAALRVEIEAETRKAVANLDEEVLVAAAREDSLKQSLLKLKTKQTSETKAATVPRRVETRNIEGPSVDPRLAQIATLKALISDSRSALMSAQALAGQSAAKGQLSQGETITAKIISPAIAISRPVFPKKKPITLLGMMAAFVLGLIGMALGGTGQQKRRYDLEGGGVRKETALGDQTSLDIGPKPSVAFGSKPATT